MKVKTEKPASSSLQMTTVNNTSRRTNLHAMHRGGQSIAPAVPAKKAQPETNNEEPSDRPTWVDFYKIPGLCISQVKAPDRKGLSSRPRLEAMMETQERDDKRIDEKPGQHQYLVGAGGVGERREELEQSSITSDRECRRDLRSPTRHTPRGPGGKAE